MTKEKTMKTMKTTMTLTIALLGTLVFGAPALADTVGRWNIGRGATVSVPYRGSTTFSVPTNIANYNFGSGSSPQNMRFNGGGSRVSVTRSDSGSRTTYTITSR
jgi:hypothetical protein